LKGKFFSLAPESLIGILYLERNTLYRYMEINIPQSLKLEHEELHGELARAIKEGGKIGNAAGAVANILHNHFIKEEEYALPPLGLLSSLSEGKFNSNMLEIVSMTEKLKQDLPHMLEEHERIVKELDKLVEVAKKENKTEIVAFAEKLKLHAKNEEEVLYPAAILVGEYLKLRK
jgi:hemerythrin HHE cation binding domain-containing protein